MFMKPPNLKFALRKPVVPHWLLRPPLLVNAGGVNDDGKGVRKEELGEELVLLSAEYEALLTKERRNFDEDDKEEEVLIEAVGGNGVRDKDKEIVVIDSNCSYEDAETRRSDLEYELSREIINLDTVQKIAKFGIPDESGLRATTWKLLLGYLPADRNLWEEELSENRSKYSSLKNELLQNPSELENIIEDEGNTFNGNMMISSNGLLTRQELSHGDHPLSLGKTSVWHQFFEDKEILDQINRDLLRTHPDLGFFSGNSSFSKENQDAMRRILLLFAKMNPEIRYVQGMNEVLAPICYVFRTDRNQEDASHAEADSFACFVRVLSDTVDHFCQQLDNSSGGIYSTLAHLSEVLRVHDEELWHHLEIVNKVSPQFYAFRWITLLLTQEFSLQTILRIWDSILSDPLGVQDMLLRICCAMLLCVRNKLLNGDFISNLKLLQHYPQIDIDYLLKVADGLTTQV